MQLVLNHIDVKRSSELGVLCVVETILEDCFRQKWLGKGGCHIPGGIGFYQQ